jgi:TrmH family RNA methyltransferase
VLAAAPRLIAVAVQLSEPGNAGTLIRVADAMGADAVILAGNAVDPYNSKCLRASAGSIFSIPVLSETDETATVARLRDAGLQVLATTVDGEVSLADPEFERALAAPTAWLFGPEAHGLPTELAAMADHRVRIPMPGNAESLNIASAASICLYQSARS